MGPMGGRDGRVVCEADNLNKKNPYVWWKPHNEKNSIHLQFLTITSTGKGNIFMRKAFCLW